MSLVNMLIAALVIASLQQLLVVGTYSDTYGAYRGDVPRPTPTAAHHHRHQHFVTSTKASNHAQGHPHHHQHGFKHHHQQQHQTPWLRSQQEFKFSAAASTKSTAMKATHKKQHSQQRQQQQQLQQWSAQSLPTSTAHSGHRAALSHASLRGHSQPSSHQARVIFSTTTASLNDNQAQTSSPSPPSTFIPEASQAAMKHAHHLRSSAGDATDHERPRSKSSESDYADDYYDVDDVFLDDEYEEEDAANELDEAGSTARGGSAGRKLHAGRRHLDEEQLLAPDEDYADDEPYRSSAEVYQNDAPGILTDQKFRELGTLEAVQLSRDKYLLDQERSRQKTPAELAREHMDRMKTAGRCSRPLPRVIHVSNETSKRYVPYCTILHRCGEDTGCCDSTRQVCAAKSFEDVPVYFFVIKVSSRSNKRDTELLMLRNHTECHCVDRSILSASMQYMPRGKRSDLSHPRYHLHQHHRAGQLHEQHQALVLPQSSEPAEAANTICRCPKHFDVFPEDVPPGHSSAANALRCRCDCLSHNLPCHRLQSGEEGFAVDERKCIAESGCQVPVCLHGDYDRHTGRCPRRKIHKRPLARYDYGYG